MASIIYARGCGPFEYDCVNEGASADFVMIASEDFDDETVQNSTWEAVSGCTVSNLVIEDSKVIDGITYSNVVTARIGSFTSGTRGVTKITFVGDLSAQSLPYTVEIPVN